MAFPRNSLRAFLSHAKSTVATAIRQKEKVTLVVGNESADLDSFTSSLLYAYIRSLAPPRAAFTPLYIPVLNIPASDISLRPEFTALFHHANITASHLVTLDDLPPFTDLVHVLQPENTRWILVDHNKLQGELGSVYSSQVYGVIDHHEEENAVPQDTDPDPRTIEKCGSCTSLVVRYCKSTWDAISSSSLSSGAGHAQGDSLVDDGAVSRTWDAQVAKLALSSILIDTANLTSKDKVEQVDKDAVAYLEAKIQFSPKVAKIWDRTEFYREINSAKKNIQDLALKDILRKDYKGWTENGKKLGMSSVVRPLDFLAEKAGNENPETSRGEALDEIIERFMSQRDLSIFAIMTTSTSPEGQFRRELLLQCRADGADIASRFEKESTNQLGLESLPIDDIEEHDGATESKSGICWRKVWLQKELGKSRKQVGPLLRNAMK
ncbi:Exopolyphosphatase [Lignoscripta atroalba]|nr:Exopolyphosphatase [Lignoscripta atroalba]